MRMALRSATRPSPARSCASTAARAAARSWRHRLQPAGVVGRGFRGQLHGLARSDGLGPLGGDRHHQTHIPGSGRQQRLARRRRCRRCARPPPSRRSRRRSNARLNPSPGGPGPKARAGPVSCLRPARRPAPAPRSRQPRRPDPRPWARCCGWRPRRAGRHAPRGEPDRESDRTRPAKCGGAGAPSTVMRSRRPGSTGVGSETHRGFAAEICQGQRQAARGGQVQGRVAFAPVLDQRDVGACPRGDRKGKIGDTHVPTKVRKP